MSGPGASGPPVVAGVDVGNATTEVVLAQGGVVLAAGRAPTRRSKGSVESLAGAAALVRRLERQHGLRVGRAAVARLRPVRTSTLSVAVPPPATGRLRVAAAGSRTVGRVGAAVGRPYLIGVGASRGPVPPGPLVAIVPPGTGFRAVVEELRRLPDVVAVVLADDEAVLVSNRWPGGPVVDEVDVAAVVAAELVAVEVGEPLQLLLDPLRLSGALALRPEERPDAARLALALADRTSAVVVLDSTSTYGTAAPQRDVPPGPRAVTRDGRELAFPAGLTVVRDGPVGLVAALDDEPVDDLWGVDLEVVARTVLTRSGVTAGSLGLAVLGPGAAEGGPADLLAELLGVPVSVGDEAAAARRGALSTPGAPSDAMVVDLGGGTIDVVGPSSSVTAAGSGDLLSEAVAVLVGTTRAAAEYVKRGAALHVQAPQVTLREDGARVFLDRPAPPSAVGGLAMHGPAGLLAFGGGLTPGEWRALRQRVKVDVLGANVARCLRGLAHPSGTVLVVGGPAGDDECLATVARALAEGVAVARGDVAGGVLGHRYAVAYGLAAAETS